MWDQVWRVACPSRSLHSCEGAGEGVLVGGGSVVAGGEKEVVGMGSGVEGGMSH